MLGPRPVLFVTLLAPLASGCASQPTSPAHFESAGPTCEANKGALIEALRALPERALSSSADLELPEADLGGFPGSGPLLRVGEELSLLDDDAARDESHAERARQLEGLGGLRGTLYVAAEPSINVSTLRSYLARVPPDVEVKLLYRTPAVLESPRGTGAPSGIGTQLVHERDPKRRRALALEGYSTYSSCTKVQEAARSAQSSRDSVYWSKLRANLLAALPSCNCDQLDTVSLKQLLVAEQRAGSMRLGAIPFSFLADERCGASMPLRSVHKLLGQVERFDEDYAGSWKDDALSFEKVITNERLLGYFCDALPGETLAALQRRKATVYIKLATGCQAWRFAPLSPGAPMGTWHRVEPASPPLSVFYWQAAEQIRTFGPSEARKKPTDPGPWACEKALELAGVDETSINLTEGHWFFTDEACRAAPASAIAPNACFVAPAPPAVAVEGEQTPTN